MDPFSGRVLSSLIFALGLGSFIGCLGYLLAATRSLRREAASTERADEDTAATAGGVSNISTDGGGGSDIGGFVFGNERDGGEGGDIGNSSDDGEHDS